VDQEVSSLQRNGYVEVIRPRHHEMASLFQPLLFVNLVKTKDLSLSGPNMIRGMMTQKNAMI
jgi:hypothetical protein